MTTWERIVAIYLDVDAQGEGSSPLLDGKSSQRGAAPVFVQGDEIPLQIWFRRKASVGEDSESVDLPENFTIVVAAKPTDDLTGELLFYADVFVEADVDGETVYSGAVDLNTAEIETALGDLASIPILVDVEIQTAGNAERSTLQFAAVLKRQVYANDDQQPTESTPPYPAIGDLVVKHRGTLAIGEAADSVTASGLALGFVPAQVLVSVRKPAAAGDNLFAAIRGDSITADGFTVDLSAAAPAAGYKLDYLIIE